MRNGVSANCGPAFCGNAFPQFAEAINTIFPQIAGPRYAEWCLRKLRARVLRNGVFANCGPAFCGNASPQFAEAIHNNTIFPQIAGPQDAGAEIALLGFRTIMTFYTMVALDTLPFFFYYELLITII